MIQNYTDVINLLRMIALQDGNVASFFVGEDERITQATRSSVEWPAVWVEYADGLVKHEATGSIQVDYLTRIFVLGGVVTDDEPKQEDQLRKSEDIVKLLLLRLRTMHKKRQIRFFIEGTSWKRVAMATPDASWGWEITFRIGDNLNQMCVDGVARRAVSTLCVTGIDGEVLALGLSSGEGSTDGSFDPEYFGDMFDIGESGGASTVYEVQYDGSGGEALVKAIWQLADAINSDPTRLVDAIAYGEQLFLRAVEDDTIISIDTTQGDFSWVKKFEF